MAGQLLIRRPKQVADFPRRYKLFIDDAMVGHLSRGDRTLINLPIGDHYICAWIDWCRSNELRVTISDNEITEVEIGATARGAKLMGWLYFLTIGRTRYLYAKERPRRTRHGHASQTTAPEVTLSDAPPVDSPPVESPPVTS